MDEQKYSLRCPELSDDLLFAEILPKLPVKSLIRFRCVSRSWLTRISTDSNFITDHLNHHSTSDAKLSIFLGHYVVVEREHRPVYRQKLSVLSDTRSGITKYLDLSSLGDSSTSLTVAGSCNGLVCLCVRNPNKFETRFVLWNPATRRMRFAGDPFPTKSSLTSYGFGFDHKTKDYKIVRLVSSSQISLKLSARVFSKRSNAWGEDEKEVKTGLKYSHCPVAADGALYWAAFKRAQQEERRVNYILCFDLGGEECQLADVPGGGGTWRFRICKWKDRLGALVYESEWRGEGQCCLWTMSLGNGGEKSWRKMFRIHPWIHRYNNVGVWRDQFLFETAGQLGCGLALFEPSALWRVTKVETRWPCWFFDDAHDYFETLLSVF